MRIYRYLPLVLLTSAASAATVTWDDVNATTTSWDTPGAASVNWIGGTAPIAGDDVIVTSDGAFDPTNNSTFSATTLNSLTLVSTGANNNLTLNTAVQIGAGGIYNNLTPGGSLTLGQGANLTADSTWGGTRTIFVNGSGITGTGKMTFEGTTARFDVNSATWSAGLDVRTGVQMSGGFAASTTITPWGTGPINLINQLTDLTTNSSPGFSVASGAGNISLATANTLANDIVLQDPGTGNFSISQNNNASQADANHHYILSGVISGDVNSARNLTFSNGRSNSEATFVLSSANTHDAQTVIGGSNPLTLALDNVDALQDSTLDTGAANAIRQVTFTVAGANTYNLGGLEGADDLDFGANTLSIGSNNSNGTFSGALNGTGNIIKNGTGNLTLSGTNTFGTTTVNDGVLIATTPASLPGYDSAASVTFDGGAIAVSVGAGGWSEAELVDLSTNATKNSGFIGIDTSIASLTQTSAYNFSPLGLQVLGSNQLTLNQTNTFASTQFEGASLIVASDDALGAGAVTGSNNAVLTFDTPADATIANDITLSVMDDSGIVNASTTSTLTFSGNVEIDKNYAALVGTGVTNAGFVISGTLTGGPGSRMGIKDTSLTLTSTGSVVYNSFQRMTLAESGGDGAAVYLQDGATLDTRIQDSNNRVVTAGKTFIVGMLEAGNGTFSGNGGVAIDLVKKAGSVANNWEITAVTGATALFSGDIRSSQAVGSTITKTGDGTVIFAADNTYDGATTISAGTLQIGNGGSTGSLNPLSTITNNGALIFNTSASLVQGTHFSTDPITGTGSLSIVDANVTLNAANTYSGGTSIDSGVLTVGATGAVPAGAITGINGSAVAFDTAADTTFSDDITLNSRNGAAGGLVNNSTTSSVTLEGTVELTAGFATVVGTGVNNAGFVLGNGGVLKAGSLSRVGLKDTSLTIEAGGAVDYSGTGFKRLTLAETGGAGAAVYLEDTVDLDMVIYDTNNTNVASDTMELVIGMKSAGTATFSGLSGVAVDLNRRNNAGSLANEWEFTAVAGATSNFTGRIANANTNSQATINKTGDGVVSFQATNTYAGATTVSAGTLELAAGDQASPITVNGGAALGFVIGSSITSTAAVDFVAGSTVSISGTPTLASYTLITASAITGAPTLTSPVAGYELNQTATTLTLDQTGGGAPYTTWAGGASFGDDANGDGVDNGLAFILGAADPDADALSLLPDGAATGGDLVMTFSIVNPIAPAVLSVEYSNDLTGLWTSVVVPATAGTTTDGLVEFVITGTDPLSVTATIDSTAASVDGALFGRLSAVE